MQILQKKLYCTLNEIENQRNTVTGFLNKKKKTWDK